MKLGIIGAENSHAAAIAKVINVEQRFKGVSVDYLWGETDDFARQTAEAGRIPNIVKQPREMLGEIDGLIVDHRHPKHHLRAARPFVEQGVPAFIDKPFCYNAAEGSEFLRMARRLKTPVTSYSIVPFAASARRFYKRVEALGRVSAGMTCGPCDLKSKYGGVFFYGIHQVELALEAFGYDVASVRATRNGANAAAQLLYKSGGIVTLSLIKEGAPGFAAAAVGEKGTIAQAVKNDASPYLKGVRTFLRMFKTREEPRPHEQILRPIEVLEAIGQSLKSGQTEKIRAS